MVKAPRAPLSGPPHRYAGHYTDRTGGRFLVPTQPDFALFRCNENGFPLDFDSPLHRNEVEFTAALGYGTFSKIIA